MVGDLIGKGLCRLSIHWVNSWEYWRSGNCDQDGVCRRCGAKCVREHHNKGWFDNDCPRCGWTPPPDPGGPKI